MLFYYYYLLLLLLVFILNSLSKKLLCIQSLATTRQRTQHTCLCLEVVAILLLVEWYVGFVLLPVSSFVFVFVCLCMALLSRSLTISDCFVCFDVSLFSSNICTNSSRYFAYVWRSSCSSSCQSLACSWCTKKHTSSWTWTWFVLIFFFFFLKKKKLKKIENQIIIF